MYNSTGQSLLKWLVKLMEGGSLSRLGDSLLRLLNLLVGALVIVGLPDIGEYKVMCW